MGVVTQRTWQPPLARATSASANPSSRVVTCAFRCSRVAAKSRRP